MPDLKTGSGRARATEFGEKLFRRKMHEKAVAVDDEPNFVKIGLTKRDDMVNGVLRNFIDRLTDTFNKKIGVVLAKEIE